MVAHANRSHPTAKRRSRPAKPAEALRQVGRQARDVVEQVRDGAASATAEFEQQLAELARTVRETIRDEADQFFTDNRDRATTRVAGIAKATRQTAHALRAVRMDAAGKYVDNAARRVQELSRYLKDADLARLSEDAADIARRHRGLVAGGLLLAGFVAARFLKASATEADSDADHEDEDQQ
jgi:hypothetical protein